MCLFCLFWLFLRCVLFGGFVRLLRLLQLRLLLLLLLARSRWRKPLLQAVLVLFTAEDDELKVVHTLS
jgi:hypothetical protein